MIFLFGSKNKREKRHPQKKSKAYTRFSALLPDRLVRKYKKLLVYADMEDVDVRVYVGFSLTFSIMMGFILFFALQFLRVEVLWSLIAGSSAAFVIVVYFYIHLILVADSKARRIEQVLPDALQLVAANVRAGMTIDKALWLTARPELGSLEKELRRMAAQTLGGKSLKDTMLEAGERVKSIIFHRAMLLMVQGIQLGGELSGLLTEISRDIRQQQALKKEINAATTMYMIFIMFASLFAAPLLFAVSIFYVETTTTLWQGQVASGIGDVGSNVGISVIKFGGVSITSGDVSLFSIAAIAITTFFGALTLGLIRDGSAKRGLKFVPMFMGVAFVVHFVGYFFIKTTFGAFMV